MEWRAIFCTGITELSLRGATVLEKQLQHTPFFQLRRHSILVLHPQALKTRAESVRIVCVCMSECVRVCMCVCVLVCVCVSGGSIVCLTLNWKGQKLHLRLALALLRPGGMATALSAHAQNDTRLDSRDLGRKGRSLSLEPPAVAWADSVQ